MPIRLLCHSIHSILYPLFRITIIVVAGFVLQAGAVTLLADEPQHFRQSIRALGMGNAFVAAVNDENALYYNPAGLQSVQHYLVDIVTLNLTVSQNVIDFGQEDSDDQSAYLGEQVGKKMYTEMNVSGLSVSGPGWGYSLFGSGVVDAVVHNPTVPYLEAKVYLQWGVIGGWAMDFWDKKLDVGINIKYVSRRGISRDFHVADALDEGFSDALENEAITATAYAPDLGFVYHIDRLYNLHTKLAWVIRNIGDMDFGNTGSIPMTMDLGVATESELAGFDIIMAADYLDLFAKGTEKPSAARNLKLGVEVGVFKRSNGHHAVSIRVGRNGMYPTYGFSLNPPYLPFKLEFASWSEEVGAVAGEKEDKRISAHIGVGF